MVNILTYNVVSVRALTVADLVQMGPPFQWEMLNGRATTIKIAGIALEINDALIIQYDIKGFNGVVQRINAVLLPSE